MFCTCCCSVAWLFWVSSAVILSWVRAGSVSRLRNNGCLTCRPNDVMYAGVNSVKKLLVVSRATEVDAVAVAPLLNRRLSDADPEKSFCQGARSPGGAPEKRVTFGSR